MIKKTTLEDYQLIDSAKDIFEWTFYYGDDVVIAQISTDIVTDYNDFEVFAVVLSAQQYDDNDQPTELTMTSKEIEKFVEEDMMEFFDDYLQGLAESVWHHAFNQLPYIYVLTNIRRHRNSLNTNKQRKSKCVK